MLLFYCNVSLVTAHHLPLIIPCFFLITNPAVSSSQNFMCFLCSSISIPSNSTTRLVQIGFEGTFMQFRKPIQIYIHWKISTMGSGCSVFTSERIVGTEEIQCFSRFIEGLGRQGRGQVFVETFKRFISLRLVIVWFLPSCWENPGDVCK